MLVKCSLLHRRFQSPVALKPANAGSLHLHKKLMQGGFVFTSPWTNLILSERSQCQGPPAWQGTWHKGNNCNTCLRSLQPQFSLAQGCDGARLLVHLGLAGCTARESAWSDYPNAPLFLSLSWQEALAIQKALLKEFFASGPGAGCALTSLYFQERYMCWHLQKLHCGVEERPWGRLKTKLFPFSHPSLMKLKLLQENGRCLDVSCRHDFKVVMPCVYREASEIL